MGGGELRQTYGEILGHAYFCCYRKPCNAAPLKLARSESRCRHQHNGVSPVSCVSSDVWFVYFAVCSSAWFVLCLVLGLISAVVPGLLSCLVI